MFGAIFRCMNINKNILAFDTALTGCNVALLSAQGKRITKQVETQRDQAKLLVPMIQEALDEGGLRFDQIDLIVSTQGPGSFTGLRLGLATARALGIALNKPIMGINSFDFMHAHYRALGHEGALLIVLETKRKDFYAQGYDAQAQAVGDPMAAPANDIVAAYNNNEYVLGGDCLERFNGVIEVKYNALESVLQPDPILLCDIAAACPFPNVENRPEPIYLRGADVSKPKNKPRQLAS